MTNLSLDPAAPATAPNDVAEALAQAHDEHTLGTAYAKRLLANGKHEAAEVVRAMLGAPDGIINPGVEHAAIVGDPPNPAGRT